MKRDTARIPCVLCLETPSESINYRYYLDRLGDQIVYQWWIEHVLSIPQVEKLYVICHSDFEFNKVTGLIQDERVKVFKARPYSQIPVLAELIKMTGDVILAMLPTGFAFAPKSLLDRMLQHHMAARNDFSWVQGFPIGVGPIICTGDLINNLNEFSIPGTPTEIAVAVHRLLAILKHTGEELPFCLKAEPFDAFSAYSLDPTTLPESVNLEIPKYVELARRVCSRLSSETGQPSELQALLLWKEEATKHNVQRRSQLKELARVEIAYPVRATKRVLYVSKAAAFSGAEQSLCQLVSHIDLQKYQKFALVSLEGLLAEKLREAGATVLCPQDDFSDNTVDNFLYVFSTLRTISPDVIHLNGLDGYPILKAAALLEIPVIQHLRNADMTAFGENLRSADAIIAISDYIRRKALQFEIMEEKLHTIYNEVDTQYFSKGLFPKQTVRKGIGIPSSAKTALMIARFTPYKRHDLMLQAATKVRALLPEFRLILNGEIYWETDCYQSVQEQAKKLGLWEIITWVPFVSDIRKLHEAADVLVLCSDGEPLGRCVVEAMAMEVPVVVTNSGGTHEIIEHRKTGFVVDGGSSADLAHYIIETLTNESLHRDMAQAARSFVELNLSAKLSAEKVMKIYDSVVRK